jgi:hypothetical protein
MNKYHFHEVLDLAVAEELGAVSMFINVIMRQVNIIIIIIIIIYIGRADVLCHTTHAPRDV